MAQSWPDYILYKYFDSVWEDWAGWVIKSHTGRQQNSLWFKKKITHAHHHNHHHFETVDTHFEDSGSFVPSLVTLHRALFLSFFSGQADCWRLWDCADGWHSHEANWVWERVAPFHPRVHITCHVKSFLWLLHKGLCESDLFLLKAEL